MNASSPQFSFDQCAFRLCDNDPERSVTSYTILVKVNNYSCLGLRNVWATCDESDNPYPYVEATYVDYDTTAPQLCRDVLIRVHTNPEENISVDLQITSRDPLPVNNTQPDKRTCPCLFSTAPPSTLTTMLSPMNTPDIVLTTTTIPDATLVSPTSMPPTPQISVIIAKVKFN